ncbi:MAG: helix-turn-helix domain-containing protein [Gemmatimonadetes bacterium]|nr:helix-turn-helix domain-containing protein [Gemmatimonadota bacterium]
MLDRHVVQRLLAAGVGPSEIARQLGISARTVERIAPEPPVTMTCAPEWDHYDV